MPWIPRQRQIGAGRNDFKIEVPMAQKYPGEVKQLVCPLGKLLDLFSIPLPALPPLLHMFPPWQEHGSFPFPPQTHSDLSCIPDRNLLCMHLLWWCSNGVLNVMGEHCEGEYVQVLLEDLLLLSNPSGSSCPSSWGWQVGRVEHTATHGSGTSGDNTSAAVFFSCSRWEQAPGFYAQYTG